MLNTEQIRRALRNHRITSGYFDDVYACDTLPAMEPETGYVMNTDPSHLPGEHWIAMYLGRDGVLQYMDSMGMQPPGSLKKYKIRTLFNRVQGILPFCGYYCLLFILSVKKPCVLNVLDNHCSSNDRIVKLCVSREFDV